jgi:hypothetical protein
MIPHFFLQFARDPIRESQLFCVFIEIEGSTAKFLIEYRVEQKVASISWFAKEGREDYGRDCTPPGDTKSWCVHYAREYVNKSQVGMLFTENLYIKRV